MPLDTIPGVPRALIKSCYTGPAAPCRNTVPYHAIVRSLTGMRLDCGSIQLGAAGELMDANAPVACRCASALPTCA